MDNIERAKKYIDIKWNDEEKRLIGSIFSILDTLSYNFEKVNDMDKAYAILDAKENLQDVVLAFSMKDIFLKNKGKV
jgi:hypothetical protein